MLKQKRMLPSGESEFNTWVINYVTTLVSNAAIYRLSDAEVKDLKAWLAEWQVDFPAAVAARDQAQAAVQTKDETRAGLEAVVRSTAKRIQAVSGGERGGQVEGTGGADSRIVARGLAGHRSSLFSMRVTRVPGRLASLSAWECARRFERRLGAKLSGSLRDLTVGELSLPWARSIMIRDCGRFKVPAFAVVADVGVC